MGNQEKSTRLITIPVSHYCEKVRWALSKLKISFVEEGHMPPFHRFITGKLGGSSTPILITNKGVFTDSNDIFKYLDLIVSDDLKIYPKDIKLSQKVEELEKLFNSKLGPCTRRWGYSYVMNDKKRMQTLWTINVPRFEKVLFPIVFPQMRFITRQQFDINPDSVSKACENIRSIFEQVSELLSDGRKYLVGDRLSAADITFSALASPVILPPEHPIQQTSLEDLPPKMVSEIKEFRATPAGAFVLRLYATERN